MTEDLQTWGVIFAGALFLWLFNQTFVWHRGPGAGHLQHRPGAAIPDWMFWGVIAMVVFGSALGAV
jgi:hypothetical protein